MSQSTYRASEEPGGPEVPGATRVAVEENAAFKASHDPKVSVIVIARNEEKTITGCLSSILEQDYPDFEIILVHSGSGDEISNMERFVSGSRRKIVIASDARGPASARNTGLRICQGEIIGFVDGDCCFDRDWLKRGVGYLLQTKGSRVAAVGGRYIQVPQVKTITTSVISDIESTFIGGRVATRSHKTGNPRTTRSLFLKGSLFWAKIIHQAGPFDEQLQYCEDSELEHRLKSAGYKFLTYEDIGAFHTPKYNSLREYARRMWNYGLGRGRAVRLHRKLLNWTGLGSLAYLTLFAVTVVLGFPLGFVQARLLAVLLGGSYLLTLTLFSIVVSRRQESVKAFFLSMAAYLTLHASYTLGFAAGILLPRR